MHSRAAWNDYFTESPTLIETKEYSERQTPSGTYLYILNCLFRSITSTSSGGALYCTSATHMLVESSSFFTCKTSGNYGGAIHFNNKNSGQCILHKVCGYDCSSPNTLFSYVNVKNDVISKNYINYSSVLKCVNENSNSGYMLCHQYGKFCCSSVNVSINKCYHRSGIDCHPFSDSNFVTASLSYSTIADNNATGHTCISFAAPGAKYEIKSCNILRNIQGDLNTQGTIYTRGYLMIEDSCILENKANYILYAESSSYTITISNCTSDSTSCNTNINMQSTVTKSFILALNHLSTQNCHSEYDAVGTLTPVMEPSKNQKHCCTCGRMFYQCQLSDSISLLRILIFNFIHPYASIDPLH
jgi:hypothetical protein